MGSPNKFGWLTTVNVTSLSQATKTRDEIPLRLVARAFACSLRSTRKSSTSLRMTG